MQARLQRLILEPQAAAGFFGRQPLNVAEHDGRPVDLGQLADCRGNCLPKLRAKQLFVGHA
jgi:hypothetical protein